MMRAHTYTRIIQNLYTIMYIHVLLYIHIVTRMYVCRCGIILASADTHAYTHTYMYVYRNTSDT